MFSNLEAFWKQTTHKNVKVICFTATADDGKEKGSERSALNELGYKIYYNCSQNERKSP